MRKWLAGLRRRWKLPLEGTSWAIRTKIVQRDDEGCAVAHRVERLIRPFIESKGGAVVDERAGYDALLIVRVSLERNGEFRKPVHRVSVWIETKAGNVLEYNEGDTACYENQETTVDEARELFYCLEETILRAARRLKRRELHH